MTERKHYSENLDSSLSTFKWDLVLQAAEKERLEEYPISRIAQIFNRSIKEGNYKIGESGQRGKHIEGDVFVDTYYSGPDFPIVGRNNIYQAQGVELRSLTLPKNYDLLKKLMKVLRFLGRI